MCQFNVSLLYCLLLYYNYSIPFVKQIIKRESTLNLSYYFHILQKSFTQGKYIILYYIVLYYSIKKTNGINLNLFIVVAIAISLIVLIIYCVNHYSVKEGARSHYQDAPANKQPYWYKNKI